MAGRSFKKGLDYFKLSVDYGTEDAIELIDGEFGAKGFRCITKLLQRIYKKDGYYIEWSEKRKILFANAIGEPVSLVDDIITRSFKWGLFDQSVFTQLGILTSADIQLTYLEAVKRREQVEIINEISLCDTSAYTNVICVNINRECGNENQQSKVKNSTVNKSKEDSRAPAAPTDPKILDKREKKTRQAFVPPTLRQAEEYFIHLLGNPKNQNYWPEDRCKNEAGTFIDHYVANGWKQGRGKPIVNWQAACRNWVRNELKGVFSKPAPTRREDPPPAPPPPPASVAQDETPRLPKLATEINYLYGRYLEGEITIISVSAEHYDFLKKTGMVNFTKEEAGAIRQLATAHITDKNLDPDDANVLKFMKLFGVIEFFQQLKNQARETVYDEKA